MTLAEAVPRHLSSEDGEPLGWMDRLQITGLFSGLAVMAAVVALAVAFADTIGAAGAGGVIVAILAIALLADPSIWASLAESKTRADIVEWCAARLRSDFNQGDTA